MKNTLVKARKYIANTPESGVLLALVLIMGVTQLINPHFLSAANMTSMLKSIPFIALATLGASFCLITQNVDISIGRVAGLVGMVFGYILTHGGNLPLAILGGLGVGLLVGVINGVLVVHVGVSSFIATMGTLYISGGLRFLINKATAMTLPESYRTFSQATPLGISWFFWIVVAIYVIVGFVQRKTVYGRQLYAVGSNIDVAKLQGVNTKWVQFSAYLISGFCAAIAGIMATIDISSAQPATGTAWEFKAVAACFVGGTSLSGGTGRAFGVALGVFVVFVISNIINMIGLSNYWSDVFTGCVLAGSVLIDIARKSRKIRE